MYVTIILEGNVLDGLFGNVTCMRSSWHNIRFIVSTNANH